MQGRIDLLEGATKDSSVKKRDKGSVDLLTSSVTIAPYPLPPFVFGTVRVDTKDLLFLERQFVRIIRVRFVYEKRIS